MGRASLKRAVTLMTVSSALVPVIGVVSAPLLTHALGVAGRGTLSVATAPNVLLAGVVTLGLPEAITFFTARSPRVAPRALRWSAVLILALSVLGVLGVVALTPFLTGGDPTIGGLVLVGSLLAVPLLLLSLVRGAAAGLQMWGAIAVDRVLSGVFRLGLLAALLLVGHLTVLSALIATTAGPLIGVVAYVRLPAVERAAAREDASDNVRLSSLLLYGARTWFGSVAGILLSRINQLLFAPLSDVRQLGLYVVAVTVSDVPLITALAVRDALFGVSSKHRDAAELATAMRITVFLGLLGSAVVAGSLPFWIAPIFGAGFVGAVPSTQVLLLSSVVNIPAFIAAAGLAAWGRPGVRSVGLTVTLVVNVGLFLVLVPSGGALGAALAALLSAVVSAVWMTLFARTVLGVTVRELTVVRREDLRRLLALARGAVPRRRRRSRSLE